MASNNFFNRLKSEINYYRMKNWSFKDVGDFWDTIEEYDDINSGIYFLSIKTSKGIITKKIMRF